VEGLARFGFVAKRVLGVAKPKMEELARRIGKDHWLALELRETGVHGARILAGMVDGPDKVTAAQVNLRVREFDNWDVCDGTCCHLFAFAAPAWDRAIAWTKREPEFEKRAGFALVACLAYRHQTAQDSRYKKMPPVLPREVHDDRNFVGKAVNRALRNIGKRNLNLNRAAVRIARRMRKLDSRSARWIAADALRELKSDAVQSRLRRKKGPNR